MKYVPEMTLVLNQWVNSYKRLVPGFEAPTYVTWAHKSRSDLIRIPSTRKGMESDTRIELRSPDPACNPYLAFACMLAAGMAGIEEGLQPVPASEENVFEMSEEKRRAARHQKPTGESAGGHGAGRAERFTERRVREPAFREIHREQKTRMGALSRSRLGFRTQQISLHSLIFLDNASPLGKEEARG